MRLESERERESFFIVVSVYSSLYDKRNVPELVRNSYRYKSIINIKTRLNTTNSVATPNVYACVNICKRYRNAHLIEYINGTMHLRIVVRFADNKNKK